MTMNAEDTGTIVRGDVRIIPIPTSDRQNSSFDFIEAHPKLKGTSRHYSFSAAGGPVTTVLSRLAFDVSPHEENKLRAARDRGKITVAIVPRKLQISSFEEIPDSRILELLPAVSGPYSWPIAIDRQSVVFLDDELHVVIDGGELAAIAFEYYSLP